MSSLPLSALPALQPPHLAYDPGGRDRPARPRDPVPRAPRPLRSAREDHAVDAPPLALGVGDRRDRVLNALPPLRARLSRRVFARRRIALSCAYGSWGGRRPSIGRLRQVDGSRGRGDRLRMPFMLPILSSERAPRSVRRTASLSPTGTRSGTFRASAVAAPRDTSNASCYLKDSSGPQRLEFDRMSLG